MYFCLCITVLFLSSAGGILIENKSHNVTTEDTLWEGCWQSQGYNQDVEQLTVSLGQCIKQRLYLGLYNNLDSQCVDVGDGVKYFSSGEDVIAPRDIFPEGEEPSSFRGLMDAYSSYLSRRGLEWNLGHVYPGLVMTISPTLSANGVLKFDAHPLDVFQRSQLSPGHHLLRRTILPHLLGFRMPMTNLLPLLFGILVYVAKNAVIFSKLTLIISTLLALKSLFVLQHFRPPNPHGPLNDFTDTAVSSSDVHQTVLGVRPVTHRPHVGHSLQPDLVMQLFASAMPPFRGVNDHNPSLGMQRGNRNFSWE